MKREVFFLFMIIMSFVLISNVSAKKTLVAGIIYEADWQTPVANASVVVSCYHNSDVNVQNTNSLSDGSYAVMYIGGGTNACDDGDTVIVNATKEGLGSGSNSGVVHGDMADNLDIAIINVVIPEFSLVTMIFSLTAGVVVFFVIRRR